MTTIYVALASVVAALVAVVASFLKGKSTGKQEAKIEQHEVRRETIEKVKESDNAANAQDRDDLIAGLLSDSVRGKSREGQ